ncbi:MAG: cytochrome C oxidase subunit IV family protein [Exiguobacterium profundum]|nr:MAG: cytochrome C oxidase subunit IV family protein [Exiguobacterium profundum]
MTRITPITRAWGLLLALSAASTALAAAGLAAALTLPVLALAGLKAHVILRHYLRLATAPAWQNGFDLGLTLLVLAFAGLSLAG